ncbi:MAG: gamma-glutamyltransferase [Candidatus Latescibacteria bacterium]|nr:gamma-glutamyltransferase [Candidatus Latescibacterota bacterium]
MPANWRDNASTPFDVQKQPATGSRGVVAANHPIGSAAGAQMFALGGNAIDAAVAALFALNVVEPQMVGLFGAGWINIRLADGTAVILDTYACAPAAATSDMYSPVSDAWPEYMRTEDDANRTGPLAIGVPGALKGWCEALRRWGDLDLKTVIQPAIQAAENGFSVSRYLAESVAQNGRHLRRFPETARIFLPGGRPLSAGTRMVQSDLAASLRDVADGGPDVLYNGPLGKRIVDHVQECGGVLTMEDMGAYRTVRRRAIRGNYRGYELIVPSPPCSGGVHLLQILNLLEGFSIADLGFGTDDGIHVLAECFKIAFADRTKYSGDPDHVEVPVEWLVSKTYGTHRRTDINTAEAARMDPGTPPSAESACTTHVTTADAAGNVAAMTQTINEGFGCKIVAPGTGLLLNNTMALFDPHPGMANSVGPNRRMLSSNAPTIATRRGDPCFALGTPGGVRIFPAVVQALVNLIDHGMSLQEAVEAPRVWTQGQELEVEPAIPETVRTRLIHRGHEIREVNTVAGGMNGIVYNPASGTITGAACWRADGSPVAVAGGPARPGIRFRPAVGRT